MDPKSIPDGGPAFPPMHDPDTHASGMTLRDYMAAKAIEGAASGNSGLPDSNYCGLIAKRAYDLADAMLAAREA